MNIFDLLVYGDKQIHTEEEYNEEQAEDETSFEKDRAATERTELLFFQLCSAAGAGDDTRALECIRKGAQVNRSDYDRRTALHIACSDGHEKVVEVLLAAGANVLCKDRWGNTPIHDLMANFNDKLSNNIRKKETATRLLQILCGPKRYGGLARPIGAVLRELGLPPITEADSGVEYDAGLSMATISRDEGTDQTHGSNLAPVRPKGQRTPTTTTSTPISVPMARPMVSVVDNPPHLAPAPPRRRDPNRSITAYSSRKVNTDGLRLPTEVGTSIEESYDIVASEKQPSKLASIGGMSFSLPPVLTRNA